MMACLLMALAGFLTFGDKTLGNVLNNFSSDNVMVNVARLCFGLNMLTTLPLEAFVCREVMLEFWFRDKPFNLKLHLLFSTGLVVSAMCISLLTCDLGVVFELVGATSACALAYILPPLCYIKLSTRSWKTYVAMAVVVFGFAVMCISVVQAILQLVRGIFLPFFSSVYFQLSLHQITDDTLSTSVQEVESQFNVLDLRISDSPLLSPMNIKRSNDLWCLNFILYIYFLIEKPSLVFFFERISKNAKLESGVEKSYRFALSTQHQ